MGARMVRVLQTGGRISDTVSGRQQVWQWREGQHGVNQENTRGEEGATPAPTADTAQRREFHDRISQQNLTPLWLSLANLATPEPRSPRQPAS